MTSDEWVAQDQRRTGCGPRRSGIAQHARRSLGASPLERPPLPPTIQRTDRRNTDAVRASLSGRTSRLPDDGCSGTELDRYRSATSASTTNRTSRGSSVSSTACRHRSGIVARVRSTVPLQLPLVMAMVLMRHLFESSPGRPCASRSSGCAGIFGIDDLSVTAIGSSPRWMQQQRPRRRSSSARRYELGQLPDDAARSSALRVRVHRAR